MTLRTPSTRIPRWARYRSAARYSGLSEASLRKLLKEGRLKRSCASAGRGRVLLDLRELNKLIESTAGATPARGAHTRRGCEKGAACGARKRVPASGPTATEGGRS
jgi:hypothetical protein